MSPYAGLNDHQPLLVKREADFHYPIFFEDSFYHLAKAVDDIGFSGKTVCVVSDSRVASLYLEEVVSCLKDVCEKVVSFVFPEGEESKTLSMAEKLYETLIREGLDRQSFLAALGGGVTGDLTGFAAATYLRGIPFIQIPTTLLAQVDSSVGGKTGVDFGRYKNMVGAFHQPELVYMNLSVLSTLSEEQFFCGMGEVIKTGLICDKALFDRIGEKTGELETRNIEELRFLVRRCCEIKAGIVERDPTEKGERALLNLGHTIGHAVEKLKNYELLHGQCVSIGLVASGEISRRRNMLTENEFRLIRDTCLQCHLPVSVQGLLSEDILAATRKDKKSVGGRIRFILMDGIGRSVIDPTVTDQEIMDGIRAVLSN